MGPVRCTAVHCAGSNVLGEQQQAEPSSLADCLTLAVPMVEASASAGLIIPIRLTQCCQPGCPGSIAGNIPVSSCLVLFAGVLHRPSVVAITDRACKLVHQPHPQLVV